MFANGEPQSIAKRAHTKSRRGCRECKRRKVKCDETRPLCGNCQRRFGDIGECYFEGVDAGAAGSGARTALASSSSASPSTSRVLANIKPKPIGPRIDTELVKASAAELQTLRGACSPASPLRKSIGADMLDPFATHPESKVRDADSLMKHYLSAVVFQSFPWQPKSENNPVTKYYTPLIWTDSVMFHATLQLTAVRLESRMPGFRIESRRLMGECIRLLNDRVQDPILNVSDQTVAAVAILATVEYERGDMRMFNMHLSGLRQMLDLRGGLAAIRKSSPMLANMVFWTFIVAMTETIYLQLDASDTFETPEWLQDARASFNLTTHLNLEAFSVSPNVASIIYDVNYLSQRFVRNTDYASASECLSALTFVCNSLQRVLSTPFPAASAPVTEPVSEACRAAVALHVMTPWRGLRPDPVLVINDLLHRLKAYLGVLLASYGSNELLLWLLFTGGVSALGTPERAWFTKHLIAVTGDLGLEEWEETRTCLKKVIWHEILCERSYRALWTEVKAWKEDLESFATAWI